MKPNKIQAALIIALMMSCSTTFAQLYKTDYTTKIVLTGAGFPASLNAITLMAPAIGAPYTLTLPVNAGTAGFMLTTNGAGVLSWTDPSAGVTLTGDIIGTAGANTIAALAPAGNHAVTAINLATASSLNADVIKRDATLQVVANQLGLNLATANTWTGKVTVNTGGANGFRYVDGNQQVNRFLQSDATGNATWVDLSGFGVTTVQGTANQVLVNGLTTPQTGPVILTLPQNIHAGASPTFVGMTLTGLTAQPGVVHNSAAGVLSSSAVVDADIATNTITNGRLVNSTISFTSPTSTLLVPASIALGASGAFDLNLANPNNWTGTQTIIGSGKFVYVDGNQTAGFVLTENGSGVATWTNPLTSITLGGDVTGPAGANTVTKINGNLLGPTTLTTGNILIADGISWNSKTMTGDVAILATGASSVNSVQTAAGPTIATALNAGAANAVNGQVVNHNATLTITGNQLGINLTNPNNWTGVQTFTGASTIKYVDGFQQNGYVLTSDASGNAKWTDPSISVTLAGDITGPAGTNVIAGTANAGNHAVTAINLATASTLNADVLKHDLTLKVASNQLGIDLSNANTWTGTQTFGGTAQTPGVIVFAPVLAIGTSNTLYKVTGTGTATGMANGADGRNVTLTNTGVGYITLTSNAGGADQFLIPGGDPVIMGPSATVMLQYDGAASGWRVIGGF
jgi:hypothetical protein